MCNIGVDHTRPTPVLICNNCLWALNDTQLDARSSNIIIWISRTTSGFIDYCFDIIIDLPNLKVPRGTLCNNVIIALKLKTLITLGIPRRFTYYRLTLRVSSGVSVWVRLLPDFKNNLMLWRKPKGGLCLCLELIDLPAQGSLFWKTWGSELILLAGCLTSTYNGT